jgi:hypothetical protein
MKRRVCAWGFPWHPRSCAMGVSVTGEVGFGSWRHIFQLICSTNSQWKNYYIHSTNRLLNRFFIYIFYFVDSSVYISSFSELSGLFQRTIVVWPASYNIRVVVLEYTVVVVAVVDVGIQLHPPCNACVIPFNSYPVTAIKRIHVMVYLHNEWSYPRLSRPSTAKLIISARTPIAPNVVRCPLGED